jgi:acetyl-CoA acyltransferase 1
MTLSSSFQRAEQAQVNGHFTEILPVEGFLVDPSTHERRRIVVDKDDGIRPGTTKETLGKIRSAFPQWSPACTTGGNASQVRNYTRHVARGR